MKRFFTDSLLFLSKNITDTIRMMPPDPCDPLRYSYSQRHYIDYEKCLENGIDAIELLIYGPGYQWDSDVHYRDLYGWDCDSLLVLNPNAIDI